VEGVRKASRMRLALPERLETRRKSASERDWRSDRPIATKLTSAELSAGSNSSCIDEDGRSAARRSLSAVIEPQPEVEIAIDTGLRPEGAPERSP
jgi:hypothetical protein